VFDLDGLVADLAGCLVDHLRFEPVEGASPKHVAVSVGHRCPTCLLVGSALTNANAATIAASFASVQVAMRLRRNLPSCSMHCELSLPPHPIASIASVKGFDLAFVVGAAFWFHAKFVLGVAQEPSPRFHLRPFVALPFPAPSSRLGEDFPPAVAKRTRLLVGGELLVGELVRLSLVEALFQHRTSGQLPLEGYARLRAKVEGQP